MEPASVTSHRSRNVGSTNISSSIHSSRISSIFRRSRCPDIGALLSLVTVKVPSAARTLRLEIQVEDIWGWIYGEGSGFGDECSDSGGCWGLFLRI